MSFKLGMPRITLNPLQTIDDEEAKTIVENEQLILIPDKGNYTGFWHVSKASDKLKLRRPYTISKLSRYGLNRELYFKSTIAAAVYISRHLGHSVCRAIITHYEDESESQILTNIRIPTGLNIPSVEINGQVYGGKCNTRQDTWRWKIRIMYYSSKHNTRTRNGECYAISNGRRYIKKVSRGLTFNWTIDEFRTWAADTLERHNFKCAYSCKKLTKDTVSLERLDETKGYSPENCALIDIHFQSAHNRPWSREKFLSVYELRTIDTYDEDEVRKTKMWKQLTEFERRSRGVRNQQHATELYKRLERITLDTRRNTKSRNSCGCNHEQSEITIEYLIELWEKQRGRCYYLNIPMNTHGEWQVSVERLDETRGYTKNNVVLIVVEAQNSFAQWSKEFVESVWN